MSPETDPTISTADADVTDPTWRSLCRVGGVAAFIATALFLSDIILLVAGGTPPSSAQDWFALLQDNRLAGLLQLFFTDLIGVALIGPIVLALYTNLRKANAAYSVLATTLAFVGIALVFATNSNYSLIALSDQYASATTEAQRALLLRTAESVIATGTSGTGILMAGLFLEGAFLIISIIMLQGTAFGKGIAYLGIVAHGLDLAHSIVFLIFIPVFNADLALAIGTPLLAAGGTFQLIWYPLVGWKLLQLGRKPFPRKQFMGNTA